MFDSRWVAQAEALPLTEQRPAGSCRAPDSACGSAGGLQPMAHTLAALPLLACSPAIKHPPLSSSPLLPTPSTRAPATRPACRRCVTTHWPGTRRGTSGRSSRGASPGSPRCTATPLGLHRRGCGTAWTPWPSCTRATPHTVGARCLPAPADPRALEGRGGRHHAALDALLDGWPPDAAALQTSRSSCTMAACLRQAATSGRSTGSSLSRPCRCTCGCVLPGAAGVVLATGRQAHQTTTAAPHRSAPRGRTCAARWPTRARRRASQGACSRTRLTPGSLQRW